MRGRKIQVGEINLAITRQPVQHNEVHQVPNPGLLPIAQPPPAGHPGAAAQLSWQHPLGNTAAEYKKECLSGKLGQIGAADHLEAWAVVLEEVVGPDPTTSRRGFVTRP